MRKQSWLVLAVFMGGCPQLNFDDPRQQCGDAGPCEEEQQQQIPGQNDQGASAGASGGVNVVDGDMTHLAGEQPMDGSAGSMALPPDQGGDAPHLGAGVTVMSPLQGAIDDLLHSLCACTPSLTFDQCTETTAEERACTSRALGSVDPQAGAWMMCAATYFHEAAECVRRAGCSVDAITACNITTDVVDGMETDAVTARCGEAPIVVEEAADACSAAEPMTCANGQPVPPGSFCNGVMQCSDGSDEVGCGAGGESGGGDTPFMCANGQSIPAGWHCDAEPDCGDASDEAGCPGERTWFMCQDNEFIPIEWVCDTEADCINASDENGCNP